LILACFTGSFNGRSRSKTIGALAYFTVGFTLPLVLTNGLEVKLSGALAPLTEQIKIKKYVTI